jgi:hypothetical protein
MNRGKGRSIYVMGNRTLQAMTYTGAPSATNSVTTCRDGA